jgi:N6-L-threonylcarbamoyladenine synthase
MTQSVFLRERSSPEPPRFVLGVESSCDDTACAVLDGSGRVLASVVSRQLAAHRPFGGVVPEIASREHLRNWPAVSHAALEEAGVDWSDIDLVAATRGPGLVGSLLVGLSLGRAIAYALERPFCAVHHLEGHLYSPFLSAGDGAAEEPPGVFFGLVVSGGHTSLLHVEEGRVSSLAETRDDAMGEVFDKIGKRLGLPFPGGALVDELAEKGSAKAHPLSMPRCGESLDFSYSGLKSQALVEIERLEKRGIESQLTAHTPPPPLLDLLAGFRRAAVDQIVDRLERARQRFPVEHLAVSGGVAANRLLRRAVTDWTDSHGVRLSLVALRYCGDNAAMIAHTALLRHRCGLVDDPRSVEASSRLPFEPFVGS